MLKHYVEVQKTKLRPCLKLVTVGGRLLENVKGHQMTIVKGHQITIIRVILIYINIVFCSILFTDLLRHNHYLQKTLRSRKGSVLIHVLHHNIKQCRPCAEVTNKKKICNCSDCEKVKLM